MLRSSVSALIMTLTVQVTVGLINQFFNKHCEQYLTAVRLQAGVWNTSPSWLYHNKPTWSQSAVLTTVRRRANCLFPPRFRCCDVTAPYDGAELPETKVASPPLPPSYSDVTAPTRHPPGRNSGLSKNRDPDFCLPVWFSPLSSPSSPSPICIAPLGEKHSRHAYQRIVSTTTFQFRVRALSLSVSQLLSLKRLIVVLPTLGNSHKPRILLKCNATLGYVLLK